MLRFYGNVRTIYCKHHIVTEGVFVTQLSSQVGTSFLTNCVGYYKSQCNWQYAACPLPALLLIYQ